MVRVLLFCEAKQSANLSKNYLHIEITMCFSENFFSVVNEFHILTVENTSSHNTQIFIIRIALRVITDLEETK
jgi:hypothetical protein